MTSLLVLLQDVVQAAVDLAPFAKLGAALAAGIETINNINHHGLKIARYIFPPIIAKVAITPIVRLNMKSFPCFFII